MTKLLVVDDETGICDFVENFFKERNFDVSVAHNGKEALDAVESKNPDVILLDIKMPVMDGIDTLKEIRKKNKTTKVIMITAVDDREKAKAAEEAGIVKYIKKPIVLNELKETILEAVGAN